MKIFKKFIEKEGALSDEEFLALESIFNLIYSFAFSQQLPEITRNKRLKDIEKYLSKKAERDTGGAIDKQDYLRFVRNSFMHKSAPPGEVVDRAMPMFWSLLMESTPEWSREELEHLLSYAIGRKDILQNMHGASKEEILKKYQKIFNRLSAQEKRERFRELLLSFYITPQFRAALDARKSVEMTRAI